MLLLPLSLLPSSSRLCVEREIDRERLYNEPLKPCIIQLRLSAPPTRACCLVTLRFGCTRKILALRCVHVAVDAHFQRPEGEAAVATARCIAIFCRTTSAQRFRPLSARRENVAWKMCFEPTPSLENNLGWTRPCLNSPGFLLRVSEMPDNPYRPVRHLGSRGSRGNSGANDRWASFRLVLGGGVR